MKQLSERTLIVLSFLAIYLIWGSTFLGTYWAFTAFPPFLMLAIRFISAGGLFLALNYHKLKKEALPPVRTAMAFGVLIIGIGTGAGMYSVQFLDTGISALLIGVQPLIIVLILWLIFKEAPSLFKMLGIAIGLIGLYLLVAQDDFSQSNQFWKGFAVVVIAIVAWSFGSVFLKRARLPKSNAVTAALQLLSGGLFLGMMSLLTGEDYSQISTNINTKAVLAIIYLIIFGSIIGYSAYNYLLLRVHPAQVATTTYVNPVVAIMLGWALNDETLSGQTIIAAAILLLGVFFISVEKKTSVGVIKK